MGMKRSIFFCILLCFSVFNLEAVPRHMVNLYGTAPKYAADATHRDYVNPDAPKGGELSLMALGRFDSLNPYIVKGQAAGGLTFLGASLLYVSLTNQSYDEALTEYGYAAELIEIADDLKSVTFTLRPGITFHDGSPITPEDVIFTFNTLRTKGNPLYRNYYGDVTKVIAVGQNMIRFEFKDDTNRELPAILGQLPILSKAYYSQNDFNQTLLTPPLGNGPYKIVSVKPGQEIVYERVKGWWGEKLFVNKGRYNFDRVKYTYFKDGDIAFEAFKSGNYNYRTENLIKNWVTAYHFPAVTQGRVKKLEVPIQGMGVMQGLVLNVRNPMFQDIRVRQALILAYDFEWINRNLFYGKYQRCDSYFSGTELSADPLPSPREIEILRPHLKSLPQDILTKPLQMPQTKGDGRDRSNLRKADQLLDAAGFVVKDGVRLNPLTNQPFEFEILIADGASARILGNYINNLKNLGIKARLRLVEAAQYVSRLQDFDFQTTTTVIPQSISPGNEQREYWSSKVAHVKGSRNYAGISDPVVDQLVEYLIDAPSRQELIERSKALDRVLMAGAYVVPFYFSNVTRMAYFDDLVAPQSFPKYQFDLFAFWSKKEKTKSNSRP